jgi:hypothetical protein
MYPQEPKVRKELLKYLCEKAILEAVLERIVFTFFNL